MPKVTVGGRTVFHRVGTKTQTVSICTAANREGVYAERYSLDISVEVPSAELAAQGDLPTLRTWLKLHGAEPLSASARPGARLPALIAAPSAMDPWVSEASLAVERVLTDVVADFLDRPFLHRVEHSLHADLWARLKQEPELAGEHPLRDGKTAPNSFTRSGRRHALDPRLPVVRARGACSIWRSCHQSRSPWPARIS